MRPYIDDIKMVTPESCPLITFHKSFHLLRHDHYKIIKPQLWSVFNYFMCPAIYLIVNFLQSMLMYVPVPMLNCYFTKKRNFLYWVFCNSRIEKIIVIKKRIEKIKNKIKSRWRKKLKSDTQGFAIVRISRSWWRTLRKFFQCVFYSWHSYEEYFS